MPDWCEGKLHVSGRKQEVLKFKEYAAGPEGCLDMEKFVPYPVRFKNQDVIYELYRQESEEEAEEISNRFWHSTDPGEKEGLRGQLRNLSVRNGYNDGGCLWRVGNWGTILNFCDPEIVREKPGHLYYEFETPWDAPTPVIVKMAVVFPELTFRFRYSIPAVRLRGRRLVIEKGKVIKSVCQPWMSEGLEPALWWKFPYD